MKNPMYFILSIIVFTGGILLLIIKPTLFVLSLIIFIVGLIMMIHWNTISYNRKCDECGEVFEINMLQNFTGLNGGINYQYIRCPKCQKRTWCKGVPKE